MKIELLLFIDEDYLLYLLYPDFINLWGGKLITLPGTPTCSMLPLIIVLSLLFKFLAVYVLKNDLKLSLNSCLLSILRHEAK